MTTTKIVKQYEATSIIAIFYQDLKHRTLDPRGSKDDNGDSIPMCVRDASSDFNNILFLSKIEVDSMHRGKGSGSNAIKKFCEEYKGIPIILEAGFLYEEDYNHYTETGDWNLIERLVNFYRLNGFLDVNARYGFCEESVTMLNFNM